MALKEITAEDLLRQVRRAAGLPIPLHSQIDEPLLAALVRRASGFLCPCSRATVASAVAESLEFLSEEPAAIRATVDAAIEGLIAVGDLLELNQVTIDDPDAKGTWIFTAPPGFVRRKSGTALLLGIWKDENTPLPESLRDRIVYNRYGRTIPASEDVVPALLAQGFLQHSEEAWTKAPPKLTSQALVEKMGARLTAASPSGAMPELLLIKPGSDVSFYPGRWEAPKRETGMFVARRPQQFGALLWGLVQLTDGVPTRFLDLPTKPRWRGCDEAWYIQMAIDANHGAPQRYRCREAPAGFYLDFFSPIPSWAERRLAVMGDPAPRAKCLFSYWVSAADVQAEVEFLEKNLWLTQADDKKSSEG